MDPIGLAGGINTYSYVGDPLTWVDPLGLICKSAYSGRRGTIKAKADLEKNGFKVVAEEVTMRVKNSTTNKTYRIRADTVATDKMGNYHVFEVKNGSGRLTRNQQGTGMFDMTNPANTNSGLGGGIIRPSASKAGELEVATKGANGLPLGGNGVVLDAHFWLLKC